MKTTEKILSLIKKGFKVEFCPGDIPDEINIQMSFGNIHYFSSINLLQIKDNHIDDILYTALTKGYCTIMNKSIASDKPTINNNFKTGDYARIVANVSAHKFEIGTIVKLERCEINYIARANGDLWWVEDRDLEKIDDDLLKELKEEADENNNIPSENQT